MARTCDLLFVSMPSRATSSLPPLGFMVLCGYLEKHTSFTVRIYEEKISPLLQLTSDRQRRLDEGIFKSIARMQPRFVGFSLFPGDLPEFLPLAARIKAHFPSVRLVAGGVLPSIDPACLIFEGSPVDLAVRGDGELPLRRLLEGAAFDGEPGLAWMEAGRLRDTGAAVQLGEIVSIPAYHRVDMGYYCRVSTEIIRPYYTRGIYVFSSVGCPFRCSFCFNPGSRVKYKRMDLFIEELWLLKQSYGINSFFILDECFLANRERALQFCRAYTEAGLDLPWAMQTRAHLLTEELALTLRQAGCVHISFGVETGSDRLLESVTKGMSVQDNLDAFARCRRHGIKTFANMLYNLPGETREDIEASRAFLRRARPDHVALSLCVPLLGTRIYAEAVRPPLTPAEYGIYASNEPYTRIVDPRFRLAAHDLDLDALLAAESLRYYLRTSFGLLSLEPWYVRKVLRRTPLAELIDAIAVKVLRQLRSYARGVWKLVRKLPTR